MRVLVTRPAREARQWVHDLQAAGLDALALPLMQVGPVDDIAALNNAWQHLAEYLGVMFVSGNAVEHFFKPKHALGHDFIDSSATKTRAWATGPGTARALLLAGVHPSRLDAPPADVGQFDSEALWRVVAPQVQRGNKVLIVRGMDAGLAPAGGPGMGRDWFASRLASVGAVAEFVVAYQRAAPDFSAQEREVAREAAQDGSVWLLSSTQALHNLMASLPGQSWSGARALATHPRIAAAARAAGFGAVDESRPVLSDIVAHLQNTARLAT
jgi:uroporphyrinogen-III synthase